MRYDQCLIYLPNRPDLVLLVRSKFKFRWIEVLVTTCHERFSLVSLGTFGVVRVSVSRDSNGKAADLFLRVSAHFVTDQMGKFP